MTQDETAGDGGTGASDAPDWRDRMEAIRRSGDTDAFAAIFAHFAPRIKAYLMKCGAPPGQAEDCAQDVLVTVWRKAGQYDPARASVTTWIFTIARNRRIDLMRRDRRPEPEDLPWGPTPEPDPQDAVATAQDSAALARALRGLPLKQRDLIARAYFGDMTHREIADTTGLPLGTIKSRLRLALERLRHSMARDGGGDPK